MLPQSAESFDDWAHPKDKETLTYKNFPMPYYGFREMNLVVGHGTLCLGHYLDWLEERSPDHAQGIKDKFGEIDNFFTLFCEGNISEELYNTRYIEQHTINFLESYKNGNYGEKPFFLHCSFPDPHHPVCPPGKYKDMYNPEEIVLPNSFNDIESTYNHPFLSTHMKNPVFRGALLRESSEEEVRKFTALYYGAITLVDNVIGNILGALEKLGLADNTMVIFTSDHGDFMGDHGLLLKGPAPYNGVLQVPLIWKVPGISQSGVSDALISSIDLPKTILNILGLKERHQPPGMQGLDMTEVLSDPMNPKKEPRESCLIAQDEEVGPKGPMKVRLRHLITKEYKLTIWEGLKGYGDLFNRVKDPDELQNLWYDKNLKNLRTDLLETLLHEDLKIQSRFPVRQAAT
jgi:arylsulfatase A-like enzyme